MKKLFLILILQLFIIGGLYSNSFAETNNRDGNTFLKYCKSDIKLIENQKLQTNELVDASACSFYLNGFVDSHQIESWRKAPQLYCLPEGVTPDQLPRILVKFLEEHPEGLHEDVAGLLMGSLIKAFPCPIQKK